MTVHDLATLARPIPSSTVSCARCLSGGHPDQCSAPAQLGAKCLPCSRSGQPCSFQHTVDEVLDRFGRMYHAISSAPAGISFILF